MSHITDSQQPRTFLSPLLRFFPCLAVGFNFGEPWVDQSIKKDSLQLLMDFQALAGSSRHWRWFQESETQEEDKEDCRESEAGELV